MDIPVVVAPYSSNISHSDFILCNYIKHRVFTNPPTSIADLVKANPAALALIYRNGLQTVGNETSLCLPLNFYPDGSQSKYVLE